MNVKFLNPFVEAAYEVLRAEADTDIARGELRLDKEPYITNDVTVIISLVGHVSGNVIYGLELPTALALASFMLGESLTSFNALAQSGIAELGNVITGRASVKLAEAGYESTISPPTMLLGKGASISTLDIARLVVPLRSRFGDVLIHLALRENTSMRGITSAALPVPARPQFAR